MEDNLDDNDAHSFYVLKSQANLERIQVYALSRVNNPIVDSRVDVCWACWIILHCKNKERIIKFRDVIYFHLHYEIREEKP